MQVYTFNSMRKSMSTVINLPNGGYRVFSKGASEIVTKRCVDGWMGILDAHRCKYFLGPSGKIIPFSSKDAEQLVRNVIEPMASDGLRTICVAYKDYIPQGKAKDDNQIYYSGEPDWENEEVIIGDMTAISILGIQVCTSVVHDLIHCRIPCGQRYQPPYRSVRKPESQFEW